MTDGPDDADSTAVRTALWRALHVLVDDEPHVLDDPIGLQIADVDDDWRTRPDMDPARTGANRASIVARARAVEDTLASSGAGQYVVLGAGLDTYAQRHPGGVRVFEVDAPATSAWKRGRLAELGFECSGQLSLVPVDFEAGESWLAEAVEAGLDPASPVVVSMLGVTMYLTREAVLATLRQAASLPPGSTTVFTYSRPIEMAPPEVRPFLEVAFRGAAESGHPWLTLLTPDEAADLAREAGFAEVQVVTSNDLHDRYFAGRTDGLSPVGGEDLVIASVH
ncbi:MAG TPA: SAM-dependent methyltransferase [Gordonia sp. (in: high G+C Gram-positive bacteria)]|uniref:class I SAM-dependent methyltransferase n=1 Tax=Gordonia sp. (in: high G+C Gram-positive bacteria) TaxID=84139 RepID=UPI000FBF0E2E|nr:SAM-dependent methyltransferase [Gordonia sp. (in: high G+C Gram-positive bacteria)]RUP35733.1 MAG: SAM-dependent methyltransferase [Gordonia sp. (in: high G+C Gram-positive bacteria)]HNP57999.1 SAM-dependent methyltransferase [Gordonia sp. (in: high G+C Gram-positive bacteria)]HRC51738.1 SAM-dependent methyltransferase [Gordonia sp. (in: high G+C Gram-positive bacteria)]